MPADFPDRISGGSANTLFGGGIPLEIYCFAETRAAISAPSCPLFRVGMAVPQSVRGRSKTRHQRFDFRRDLRFADKQKRSIVEKQLAAEPLSARTELDLIRTKSVWSERKAHDFFRVASGRLAF